MINRESKAQRGQALGPTWSGPCRFSFSAPPYPSTSLLGLPSMLEGATLGPALGHLHLLFILLRMLCPEISMTASFCQSGLSSNAPTERPFLTTLTEVAHPHPIIHFSQLIFFVAVITVENYLIYLPVCCPLSPCPSCLPLYPQHLESCLTHSRCLVNIILIH